MIAIHRGLDILLEVGVNQGSIRRFNLMKEDFIRLKFSLTTNTPLLIGDYVDLTGYINSCDNENFRIKNSIADQTTKRFVLDRNYYPSFNKETSGWDYDVQINAYYHQWKNKIFMFNPSKGAAESSFSLTDNIFVHAERIKENLKYAGFRYDGTEYDVVVQEEYKGEFQSKGMKLITYSAVSIYGALDLIAQAFECEWWLDGGSTIYFGYRKGSEKEKIYLANEEEIAEPSISDSDGVHATRIYAFGGTTNIPKHYRDKLVFTADTIGNGYFYDSKRPVYVDWIRGTKSNAPFVSKTCKAGINPLDTPVPLKKIEGGVDGTFSLNGAWCLWDGGFQNIQNIDVTLRVSLGTSEGGFIKADTIMEIPVYLVLGSTSGFQTVGGYDFSSERVEKISVKRGETYAINAVVESNNSKKYDIYFIGSDGTRVNYSENEARKQGHYAYYAYNMPMDGELCLCFANAYCEVHKVSDAPKMVYSNSASFSIVKDFKAYDKVIINSEYNLAENPSDDDGDTIRNFIHFGYSLQAECDFRYRPTARKVETKILVGGQEKSVTINAGFEDDGYKISGYTPTKGVNFTFPDIILSKVSGDYFTAEEGGVQTGVVQKNLMLPVGKNYVQANGVADADVVEAIMVFDWIYPKTELTITDVQPEQYPIQEENEDGSTTTRYVTTYKITVPIKYYDSKIWVDPSQQHVIFQDGAAAGLRFEVNATEQTDNDVTFLLIPNDDYATWIPNSSTEPVKGNSVILDGIDVTYISSDVIGEAEAKLLAEAESTLELTSKEDKVVDITLSSTYAYNHGRIALGTLTSLVGVLSGAYDSRVLGFEECLDIPWDKPKYIIGDKNYYNRQASIESKLENIEKGSITLSGVNVGGGGSNIPIIKVKDSTKPTDANVYSALRSREEFAKRKEEETFTEKVTFNKDIDVKGSTKTKNLSVSNDANIGGNNSVGGNQTIEGTQEVGGLQTLHKGFQTAVFRNVAGQFTGAQLTEDGILTVAGLRAMTFEVFELIYNLIKAQSGKVTYSPTVTIESCMYAMDESEMELVTPDDFYNNNKGAIGSVWNNAVGSIHHVILTIKKTEDNKGLIPLVNNDIIYGYVNQIGESGQYSRGGQSIMHVITPDTEIGEGGSMVIRAILEPIGNAAANPNYVSSNMPPTEGMVLAQRGNINGTEGRTTSFYIDTEAGHIIMLQNVTTPTITDTNYAIINGLLPDDLLAKVRAQYPIVDKHTPVSYARYGIFENILEFAHQGGFIQRENPRGAWDVNVATHTDNAKRYKNKANYYDTVTHDGSTWKCLLSDQPDEPGTNKAVWLQLVAKGDDGTSIKIKGEKPSYSDLPRPPADESDCYIVGQDLYVWLPEIQDWHNVGQFKGDQGDAAYVHLAYANSADGVKDFSTTDASGRRYVGFYSDNIKKDSENPSDYTWMYNKGEKGDKGDDTVTLDLSNDMDSMMYSADGTKLTTDVKTTASLRVGKTVNPDGTVWLDPTTNGCTATRTGSTYTVTAIDANTNDASVTIKANYGGETYERVFSIKKIVGQAKYEVLCTPNSLTYNETTSVISPTQVNVYIYKTEQGSSGTLERNIVASLPTGYILKVNGAVVSYSAGSHEITTSSTDSEYIVELFDNNNALLDSETVSLTKVKNGTGISDEIIKYGVSDNFVDAPEIWSRDEPTNIEQGKVLWVKTTTKYTNGLPDNVTITKTYQGLDNTSVQYELRTNVNIIYIHDRESASKQSIRITVGKTTSEGYTEITDSDTLREEGFIVQYNYDSRGERKTLSFANTAMLLEGDDDTLLVGEDDSEMVYEFTVEDITSIEDHIMFYLAEVDSAGNVIQDWATREVDVVRDGDGALTIDLNEDSIVLTTSVDTEPYTIINDGKTYPLYPKVKIGGVEQTLEALIDAGNVSVVDSNSRKYTFRGNNRVVFNPDFDKYKENGVIVESLVPTWIDFTVNTTNSKGETITATKRINIIRNYRGLMGKTGALYFAQGFFSEQAAKEGLYICNEQNIGFVLDAAVKDSQDGGHYEYTGKPFRYSNNGIIYSETELNDEEKNTYKMLTPHEDYAAGGDYAWKYMPKYEVVLANFIMANNARFGHLTRGGVFYDRYLFSAYGNASGNNVPYDTIAETIFKGNDKEGYTLNGTFIPNLFLDFFGGGAKFGKLSESFIDYPSNYDGELPYIKTINFESCHNIAHDSITSGYPSVVILPKVTSNSRWAEDGTHCTIMHKFDMNYTASPTNEGYRNAVLVVCADELLFTSSDNYGNNDWYQSYKTNGWMVWKGRRVKFVFLVPGTVLKLRSFTYSDNNILWYIENASDFVVMNTVIYARKNANSTATEIESSDSTSHEGDGSTICPIIGSEQLNWFSDFTDGTRTHKTIWNLYANGDAVDSEEGRIPPIFHVES